MNKPELVSSIVEKTGLKKKDAEKETEKRKEGFRCAEKRWDSGIKRKLRRWQRIAQKTAQKKGWNANWN